MEQLLTHGEWNLMECLWEKGACTGREAVEEGLCDAVGGLQDALRALYDMMEERPYGS